MENVGERVAVTAGWVVYWDVGACIGVKWPVCDTPEREDEAVLGAFKSLGIRECRRLVLIRICEEGFFKIYVVCDRCERLDSCIRESGLRAAIGCAFVYINMFDIEWIWLR